MPFSIFSNPTYTVTASIAGSIIGEGTSTQLTTATYTVPGTYSFTAGPGTYTLKLWGAGGGGSVGGSNGSARGAGGGFISRSGLSIINNETWTVIVGAGGSSSSGSAGSNSGVFGSGGAGYGSGGNGAGGVNQTNIWPAGGGGGSTAITGGSVVLIGAGGGGGAGGDGNAFTTVPTGGHASGASGGTGGAAGGGGQAGSAGLLGGGGGGGSNAGNQSSGNGGIGGGYLGTAHTTFTAGESGGSILYVGPTARPGSFSDADYLAPAGVGGFPGSAAGAGRVVIQQTSLINTLIFTVRANVADNTTLYWTNDGTTTAADFFGGSMSGSFVMNNGQGLVSLNIINDNIIESDETILFRVRENSTTGPVVASYVLTLRDSVTISPILVNWTSFGERVVDNTLNINENGRIDFTFSTTGIPDGTTLYWTNGGTTDANDFFQGINNGTVTISNSRATLRLNIRPNDPSEINETVIIQIRLNSITGPILASSDTITIISPFTGLRSFGFTGADQIFTVPDGKTLLFFKIWGAGGGNGSPSQGGAAGYTEGRLTVNPGSQYTIRVGGPGQSFCNGNCSGVVSQGGFGGGGGSYEGNGGGGGSFVFFGGTNFANVIAAAGGGGGAGGGTSSYNGGAGGGLTSGTGTGGGCGGGAGATVSAAGAGAPCTNGGSTFSGSQLQGGGNTTVNAGYGGGGGGGYYGGGSGNRQGSWIHTSGGGGSGFAGSLFNSFTSGGSGTTPGNSTDSLRGTAGNPASNGLVVIYF